MLLSVVAAFVNTRVAFCLLLPTLIIALMANVLTPIALLPIGLIAAASFGTHKVRHSNVKKLLTALVVILCVLLAAHILPGFNNIQLLNNVEKSANSAPFNLYFNLDKPLILFALLIMVPTLLQQQKRSRISQSNTLFNKPLFYLACIPLVFLLALAFGLISIDFKIPFWWWIFAINNLLITCVVEEAFFRGFIQRQLQRVCQPIIAMLISGLLFGVAHFAGGAHFIVVATVAGFIYGGVYLTTGKLWHAVLVHFVVNLVHLLFFTYPLAN